MFLNLIRLRKPLNRIRPETYDVNIYINIPLSNGKGKHGDEMHIEEGSESLENE